MPRRPQVPPQSSQAARASIISPEFWRSPQLGGVRSFLSRHAAFSAAGTMFGPCRVYFSRNSMKIAERDMPVIASKIAPGLSIDLEMLKTVAIFCGLGLLVSLLGAANGLDLSGGLF